MRPRVQVVVAVAATGAAALAGSGVGLASVSCPLRPASAPEASWAFSQTGPPSNRRGRLISTYTHGRGQVSSGRASGTACLTEHARHLADQTLILKVKGAAQQTRPITIGGVLGARLVLPIQIERSDDPHCKHGAGKLTLFSSYNGVHLDSVSLHFSGGCARHDHKSVNGGATHVAVAIAGSG